MKVSVADKFEERVSPVCEPLALARLGADGIPGDRIVDVLGPEGIRTSRRPWLEASDGKATEMSALACGRGRTLLLVRLKGEILR